MCNWVRRHTAADIILLSASVVLLQRMLDIYNDKGSDTDIIFNARKSSFFIVGKLYDKNIDALHLGTDVISWNQSLKYLGLLFKSGKNLNVDIEGALRKFYAAANSIYSKSKYAF